MNEFDAIVVGAGPAGSTAALLLARAQKKVLLIDRATFPRSKPCGDLIGPRGVASLMDLGITTSGARRIYNMRLVGPGGKAIDLPWPRGDYPSYALSWPRIQLDDALRTTALNAGAKELTARVEGLTFRDGLVSGVSLNDETTLSARFVLACDGSLGRLGTAGGLISDTRTLWGFALCFYTDLVTDDALIAFLDTRKGLVPGYGWVFAGPGDRANIGLGVAIGRDKARSKLPRDYVGPFLERLVRLGYLNEMPRLEDRRGAWLRTGLAGVRPADRHLFLLGDAAGLVNPLQGEGIAEAMRSAYSAVEAILEEPERAEEHYRRALWSEKGDFYAIAAPLQAFFAHHPKSFAVVTRLMTNPHLHLGRGWAITWNDLYNGARPSPALTVARILRLKGRVLTSASRLRHGIRRSLRK